MTESKLWEFMIFLKTLWIHLLYIDTPLIKSPGWRALVSVLKSEGRGWVVYQFFWGMKVIESYPGTRWPFSCLVVGPAAVAKKVIREGRKGRSKMRSVITLPPPDSPITAPFSHHSTHPQSDPIPATCHWMELQGFPLLSQRLHLKPVPKLGGKCTTYLSANKRCQNEFPHRNTWPLLLFTLRNTIPSNLNKMLGSYYARPNPFIKGSWKHLLLMKSGHL